MRTIVGTAAETMINRGLPSKKLILTPRLKDSDSRRDMIAVGDKIRDKELDSRKRRLLAAAEIITNKLVQKEIDTDIVGLKDSDIRRDMMAAEIKMDLVLISRDNHHNPIPNFNQKQDFPNFPDYPP